MFHIFSLSNWHQNACPSAQTNAITASVSGHREQIHIPLLQQNNVWAASREEDKVHVDWQGLLSYTAATWMLLMQQVSLLNNLFSRKQLRKNIATSVLPVPAARKKKGGLLKWIWSDYGANFTKCNRPNCSLKRKCSSLADDKDANVTEIGNMKALCCLCNDV